LQRRGSWERLGHIAVADDDLPAGGSFEPGQDSQRCTLARARFTKQHQEFTWFDREVEVAQHLDFAKRLATRSKRTGLPTWERMGVWVCKVMINL
jgi:hypothetical protein